MDNISNVLKNTVKSRKSIIKIKTDNITDLPTFYFIKIKLPPQFSKANSCLILQRILKIKCYYIFKVVCSLPRKSRDLATMHLLMVPSKIFEQKSNLKLNSFFMRLFLVCFTRLP